MCKINKTAKQEIYLESAKKLNIKYEIIASVIDNIERYGIEVSVFNDNGCLEDFARISDITVNPIEIKRIFMILYKYTVTPATIFDILEMYFADEERFISLTGD